MPTPTSRPAIALLVDADNASLSTIDQVLTTLAEHGDVTVRRAYGNWFKAGLRTWERALNDLGFRAIQQSDPVKGKNATDLALVIDAVDLHHTVGPDAFAIVSSDSDFTPLAVFLRERGARVFGFGRATTAASFQSACHAFMVVGPAPAKAPAAKQKPQSPAQPDASLTEQIDAAIAKSGDQQGWARVNSVANVMRQQYGQAAKDHGKATWTKVLKSLPGYEFRNEGSTNVSVRVGKRG